jgi:sugar phosphate permease
VNSKRAWFVVSIATLAYVFAVLQRSSLGVAGVDATERFDVQAAVLSTLAVTQLMVYAGLQIPVGIVLDRVGPRRIIVTGSIVMALGQFTLAFSEVFWVAIVGRVLVGAGDAMTFISVARLMTGWFSGRKLPIMSQGLGTLGATGQLLSALPFSYLLHTAGWTPAFASSASLSVLAAVLVLVVVKNRPDDAPITASVVVHSPPLHTLKESLRRPGTQLGFWSHYVSQSSSTMLSLLWGFPFLSIGLGYGPAGASALLTILIFAAIVAGPILGILTARYPTRRSNLVLGIVAAMAVAWGIVLAWPGHPPFWAVVMLLIVVAVGGPGSVIGLDFARTFNPARSFGSASGIINVGGFLASFVMMFLIGVVLDLIDRSNGGSGVPEQLYSWDSFRIAFLVQYVVVGFGVIFVIRSRRRTRAKMHAEEGIVVAPLWVAIARAWRKRRPQ